MYNQGWTVTWITICEQNKIELVYLGVNYKWRTQGVADARGGKPLAPPFCHFFSSSFFLHVFALARPNI